MAIELIKNGAVFSSPVKSSLKQGDTNANTEFSLAETKVTVSTDSVSITNTVIHIRKSFDSFAESDVVDVERLARIERIKNAIENGTYKIDPDLIAAKMIQFDSLGQGNST